MRIGFDIDGVLANFVSAYAPLLSNITGKNVPATKPHLWDWDAEVATKDQIRQALDEIKGSSTFWTTLEPTEFCSDSLTYLSECRHKGDAVVFITSRPGINTSNQSKVWLEAHNFVDADVYVATSAEHKRLLAKNLELDFFIDDKPSNCLAVSDVVPYTVVLDQPWNQEWDNDKDAVMRVTDPVEAVEWARAGMQHGQ